MTDKLAHSNRRLPGKMHRWQRHASFWILGSCFISGTGWFLCLDWLEMPVPQLKPWWIVHGCSSIIAILLIGAALPQHVIVTWKARRNIRHGILVLLGFALALLSALGLFYAPEQWRDTVHWIHCIACLMLALVFPLHVVRGRRHRG